MKKRNRQPRSREARNSGLIRRPIRRCWPLFLLPTALAFCIGFLYPFLLGLYRSDVYKRQRHCRGAACRSRRSAADTNRLPIKRHAPIASVAAVTAQPLAALPPYGCGVPFTGSDRHWHSQISGRLADRTGFQIWKPCAIKSIPQKLPACMALIEFRCRPIVQFSRFTP